MSSPHAQRVAAFSLICLACLACETKTAPAASAPLPSKANIPSGEQAAAAKRTPPVLPEGAFLDDGPINLLTSTGDDSEDEARLAQAKLMGLGHKPVVGEPEPPDAPAVKAETLHNERVDVEPPTETPSREIPTYFKRLDEIGWTLSVGKDKKDFAETALTAATKGNTALLKDLRDRYTKAATTARAMQVPPKAAAHHRLTVESFEKGAEMLDYILKTVESGDLSGIGAMGTRVSEIKSLGEQADSEAAALGHTG